MSTFLQTVIKKAAGDECWAFKYTLMLNQTKEVSYLLHAFTASSSMKEHRDVSPPAPSSAGLRSDGALFRQLFTATGRSGPSSGKCVSESTSGATEEGTQAQTVSSAGAEPAGEDGVPGPTGGEDAGSRGSTVAGSKVEAGGETSGYIR